MTSLAWSDVAIMAGGTLLAVVLMALIVMVEDALKARRHSREPRRVCICDVCKLPHPPTS